MLLQIFTDLLPTAGGSLPEEKVSFGRSLHRYWRGSGLLGSRSEEINRRLAWIKIRRFHRRDAEGKAKQY